MSNKWVSLGLITYGRVIDNVEFPFVLAEDIMIDYVPNWLKDDKFLSDLDLYHRTLLQQNDIKYALVHQYEAESLGQHSSEYSSKVRQVSKQDVAQHNLILTNISIWLSRPSAFGYDYICHYERFDDDSHNLRSTYQVNELIPHHKYQSNTIDFEVLDKAKLLLDTLRRLERKGSLWASIYTLWLGLCEQNFSVRYLLLWVALESLFGPKNATELSFRLSQRIGFFLDNEENNPSDIFNNVKKCYKWRSKIVHGLNLEKLAKEKSSELSINSEYFIRDALLKILNNQDLIIVFTSNKRDEFLDSLVFNK